MQGQSMPMPYDEICRLVGDMQIQAYAQSMQAKNLIQKLSDENTKLREEIKRLQDNPLCQQSILKEST